MSTEEDRRYQGTFQPLKQHSLGRLGKTLQDSVERESTHRTLTLRLLSSRAAISGCHGSIHETNGQGQSAGEGPVGKKTPRQLTERQGGSQRV